MTTFDAADYLKTPTAIAAYLTEAFETNDHAYICNALDTAARAKGMGDISIAAGLSRESLYKTFKATAKPEFETVRKLMNSIGVKLVAKPIDDQQVSSTGPSFSPHAAGRRRPGSR
ncbi:MULTISPECIES: addiction module antidote protein [Bradyrhizobium]|uniref:addiction module antidote protein n=1 Tax=Bradyrhizobium TaxID=374 RepID=UPI00211EFDE3|nr:MULTISPECIES: addiction module antidote protein [Bradyrhizobium]